ncbi:MAG: phage scaffolding protein [Oscillospiraceae bacterium]
MVRKFLEDMGLSKEQVDKILDENSQDIGKAKGDLDSVQAKLTTAQTEIETLKSQVSDRDGQLETLKNSTGDVEGLKKQIETLQSENKTKDETHATEIRKLQRESADTELLTAAKAKNIKAVLGVLGAIDDKLDIDAYKSKRKEQLEALTKADDSKFLFDSESSKPKVKGAKPGEPGDDDGNQKVDTSKMTYSELAAYMAENPDVKID